MHDLPPPRLRQGAEISLTLRAVTPIMGGGAVAGKVDERDPIRGQSLRGILRFWWRAAHAHKYCDARELWQAEAAVWGSQSKRSPTALRIELDNLGNDKCGSGMDFYKDVSYALWTSKPGDRLLLDTTFTLRIRTLAQHADSVRRAIRAWVIFGGYGSRTRRGLGSLTVCEDPEAWLPTVKASASDTGQQLRQLLELDDTGAPGAPADRQVPTLAGAELHLAPTERDPVQAWASALKALHDFRQGTGGEVGWRAREPGNPRPSLSNWPEADKVRHLAGTRSRHTPRHNKTPAWPRASFGLPIQIRFKGDGEPDNVTILWMGDDGPFDRLASPLVTKALPLADGRYAPALLWLDRAHPPGKVQVKIKGSLVNGSEADFDRLVACGDSPRFAALADKQTLREAFFAWLQRQPSGFRQVWP